MRIQEALLKITDMLALKTHNIPLTKNKGGVGHFVETSIGLKRNSNCLDLEDGEIKAFPLKKNKNSDILVPKETIAITMVDREALKINNFEDSKLCIKIKQVIFVPYLRKGDKVLIFKPILLPLENKIMCDNIKKDYCNIQKHLLDKNELRSNIGEYIQCRTKGPRNSKTRAF